MSSRTEKDYMVPFFTVPSAIVPSWCQYGVCPHPPGANRSGPIPTPFLVLQGVPGGARVQPLHLTRALQYPQYHHHLGSHLTRRM